MSFSLDISAFCKKAGTKVGETAKAIKIELFSSVILDTRVDTGRLRGNWQATLDVPAYGNIERLDPSGMEAALDVERSCQPFAVNYLTNNLPYAAVWEERDGMIAKNMARLDRIVRRASA